MLNLLRKDFIAMKSSLWMIAVYLIIFSFAFIPKMDSSIHLVGIYTAFSAIVLCTSIDIKNRNHNFLVTLPINRKQIIQAKYITAIIYIFIGVLASFGLHLLIKLVFPQLNKPTYSLIDLVVPILITLLLTSIYMPLFYKLSEKGMTIINGIFLILLIALAQPTALFMNLINNNNLNINHTLLISFLSILLLLITSYFLTAKLFVRKDF